MSVCHFQRCYVIVLIIFCILLGLRGVPKLHREVRRPQVRFCADTVQSQFAHGPLSVIPTRYFLGRPDVGEEMHISIEKGKTLIIRLMAVGPVVEGRAQRDVWFEVNGEVCLDLRLSALTVSNNLRLPSEP